MMLGASISAPIINSIALQHGKCYRSHIKLKESTKQSTQPSSGGTPTDSQYSVRSSEWAFPTEATGCNEQEWTACLMEKNQNEGRMNV
jgi:hypothetical protein